ncbi:MAG: hypothetical protein M1457_01745 [bacterium]|nr:hypothetical protein [bacterium]
MINRITGLVAICVGCLAAVVPTSTRAESVTIAGQGVTLSVNRTVADGRATCCLESLSGLGQTIRFEPHNLWGAVVTEPGAPATTSTIVRAERDNVFGAGALTPLPAAQVSVVKTSPQSLAVRFRDVPMDATGGGTLDFEGWFRIENGVVLCDFDARLKGDPRRIVERVTFPILTPLPLSRQTDRNVLFYPLTGGLLLRDPWQGLKSRHETNYPGFIDFQTMAYYAEDGTRGGLTLTARDPNGYYKDFNVRPVKGARAFEMSISHANYAPKELADRAAMMDSLRRFDLREKGRYTVALAPFTGDWMDACDAYRVWAESSGAPFLAAGKLGARAHPSQAVIGIDYSIPFRFGGDPMSPVRLDPNDPKSEWSQIASTLDFFNQGGPLSVEIVLIGNFAKTTFQGNANDNQIIPFRDGMDTLLQKLRRLDCVRQITNNRDIGNWNEPVSEDPEMMWRVGMIRKADGNVRVVNPALKYRTAVTCTGAPYIHDRRLAFMARDFARSNASGRPGHNNTVLAGKGSRAEPCYAPLFLDPKDLPLHHHDVGGGNWNATGYRRLVNDVREKFADVAPDYYPGGESSHEQLIDTSIVSGRMRLWPFDLTMHDERNWIPGAEPVPAFTYLYHDYAVIGERSLHRQGVGKVYADSPPEDIRRRVRLRGAESVIEGRRPGFYLFLDDGTGSSAADPVPALGDEAYRREMAWYRDLYHFRHDHLEFLVYGRMLRPPRVECERRRMIFKDYGKDLKPRTKTIDVPTVLATAWRSPGGQVGVVMARWSDTSPDKALFRFDPADWRLEAGKTYRWERYADGAWKTLPETVAGGARDAAGPAVEFAAGEVGAALRLAAD